MPDMENQQPLAVEMYADLKRTNAFKDKLIFVLIGVVLALIIVLAGTNIYHIYQWSQFETIVVDSGDGDGNANYVQGDNSGGIYNGESGSQAEEEGELPGNQD